MAVFAVVGYPTHGHTKKYVFCIQDYVPYCMNVETIGNANEEVMRAYVQNQLEEMSKGKESSQQLGLF
jgi:hypothetical protein